jgi:hypothetical protein
MTWGASLLHILCSSSAEAREDLPLSNIYIYIYIGTSAPSIRSPWFGIFIRSSQADPPPWASEINNTLHDIYVVRMHHKFYIMFYVLKAGVQMDSPCPACNASLWTVLMPFVHIMNNTRMMLVGFACTHTPTLPPKRENKRGNNLVR